MGQFDRQLFLRGVFLFFAYVATAYIGLRLDPVGGFATLVWAPTGIALTFLTLYGPKLWPAVALAALSVNLLFGANFLAALGISLGNTLEAVFAVYLLKRVHFKTDLRRLGDIIKLIIFAGLISTSVSATIGVASLHLTGQLPGHMVSSSWLAWWVGDMLGNLVVAPMLLSWFSMEEPILRRAQLSEFLVWVGLTVFIGLVVLGNIFNSELQNSPLSYFIFPPLLWGALRFNKVLLLTVTFLLSIMAIWFTTQGAGPFIRPDLSESLLFLQLFIGIISVTILILCSIVQERKAAESEIRSLNKTLSEKVKAEAALNRLLVTKIGRRVKH